MNKTIEIHQIDGSWCKVSKETRILFEKCLEYDLEIWVPKQVINDRTGRSRTIREQIQTTGFAMDRRSNEFMVGLLPRITNYLNEKGYKVKVKQTGFIEGFENVPVLRKPELDGVKFRGYQLSFIRKGIRSRRGVFIAPTGSGKTTVEMGLFSMFPNNCKKLFLCHTKDLVIQAAGVCKDFGRTDVQIVCGGYDKNIDLSYEYIFCTIQTYAKQVTKRSKLSDAFTVVIIDEAHHCQDLKGRYGKTLSLTWAPFKFGFTATEPPERYNALSMEALIGPTLGELPMEKAVQYGFLATPILKLVPVPREREISRLFSFQDVYHFGIVHNTKRNELILGNAKEQNEMNNSVLILVKELEHGDVLSDLAKKMTVNFAYVHGNTAQKMRNETKALLENKKVKTVITTVIWKEGVDIPTLDCIINGCGGKSEIQTRQFPGRGMRRTKTKKEFVLIDFLDPYKYLAIHTIERLQVYIANNWL